jgi:hypothetical protein
VVFVRSGLVEDCGRCVESVQGVIGLLVLTADVVGEGGGVGVLVVGEGAFGL